MVELVGAHRPISVESYYPSSKKKFLEKKGDYAIPQEIVWPLVDVEILEEEKHSPRRMS